MADLKGNGQAEASHRRRARGFQRTSTLVARPVRKAGEARGFAVSRLLTHWAEVVGSDIAAICRPVEVGFGRGGFGATLTILTTGAQAPMLEMQKDLIRDRVNACYGYGAISRVRITQTAASGFSEGRADFEHRADPPAPAKHPAPESREKAAEAARAVGDPDLRAALETLGGHVLTAARTSQKG